jgi:hypothetical protein
MVFQKLNGFHEASRGGRHDQINGVKIALQSKHLARLVLGLVAV